MSKIIILHAIGEDGPLIEIDLATGWPIDDLKWKGDACHPEKRDDGQLTAEVLWFAQSHTGVYHDNMNFEMFILWVKQKLYVFLKTIPQKKWY